MSVTTFWLQICSHLQRNPVTAGRPLCYSDGFNRSAVKRSLGQLIAVFAVVAALSVPAVADKDAARKRWEQGTTAYNLGRFEVAINHFERAYEYHPSPAFLFNIAQCYRQMDDCERAVFFYKRYLSARPKASNRAEVQSRISELERRCSEQREIPKRPPTGTESPEVSALAAGETELTSPPLAPSTSVGVQTVAVVPAESRRPLVFGVSLGPSRMSIGDLDVPTRFTIEMFGNYRLTRGRLGFGPGFSLALTPVPYQLVDGNRMATGQTSTGLVARVAGTASAAYEITPSLVVRGTAGIGMLLFGGLDEGNPFTGGASAVSGGALAMLVVKVGAGLEYHLTDRITVVASPVAISYSPANSLKSETIDNLWVFDFLIGVGGADVAWPRPRWVASCFAMSRASSGSPIAAMARAVATWSSVGSDAIFAIALGARLTS